jgi:glycosyltransferase involved in cell wall biosynthesis
MNNTLSILICSLSDRQEYLNELLECLKPQLVEGVQVLINSDGGKKSVGHKRNELIKAASGKYIVFIDDDDLVSDDYVSLILEAVEDDCDVVGIHLLMTRRLDMSSECRTYHSLKYREWWDEPDPDRAGKRRYYRNPNHLNPVKREFALATLFPEKDHGEDHDYSKRLLPLLKTEVYIDNPIYHYQAERDRV